MNRIGTSNFVSLQSAIRYYAGQGFDSDDVQRKVQDGEITIGKPNVVLPNESLEIDSYGRYVIVAP